MGLTFSPKHDRRYCRNLIKFSVTVVFVAAIVLYIGLPIWDVENALHPTKFAIGSVSPADLGLNYTDVALYTQDKLTLRGWYVPSTNHAAVILVHAFNGNRTGTIYHAALLARRGYGVLLYDQRATGESDGENLSWGWRDVADVSDAVRYLQTEKGVTPAQIGVYGCSTGAEIALASTALEADIHAVTAEDAEYSTTRDILIMPTWQDRLFFPIYPLFIKVMEWRSGTSAQISLSEAVGRISPRPLLLISNGSDFDYLQAQYYVGLAKEPKEHWNLPDSYHCGGLTTHPQEYESKLIGFFNASLR